MTLSEWPNIILLIILPLDTRNYKKHVANGMYTPDRGKASFGIPLKLQF